MRIRLSARPGITASAARDGAGLEYGEAGVWHASALGPLQSRAS